LRRTLINAPSTVPSMNVTSPRSTTTPAGRIAMTSADNWSCSGAVEAGSSSPRSSTIMVPSDNRRVLT
jgi:hypothetical protein